MNLIQKSILQTLIYADLFDCSLQKKEIFFKLQTSRKIKLQTFEKHLQTLIKSKKIGHNNNFYFIKNRQKLVGLRQDRLKIFQKKLKNINKYSNKICQCPWVETVLLTGSMAAKNCKKNDDIDLLIITSINRLWLVRLWLILLTEVMGVRRRPKDKIIKNKICLNIFLDKNVLVIPKNMQNLYTAHEIIQTQIVNDKNNTYAKFIKNNSWVKNYLANAYENKAKTNKLSEDIGRRNKFLDNFNQIFYFFQKKIMNHKISNETIDLYQAFFHPQKKDVLVLKHFQTRIKSFFLI
jgi:hypothetical protein